MVRHFEFRKFGAKFEAVPVCYWDVDDLGGQVVAEEIDPTAESAVVGAFEEALRAAGLIGPCDVLVKRPKTRDVYRVSKLYGQVHSPSVKAAAPSGPVPSLTEVPDPVHGHKGPSQALYGLDGERAVVSRRLMLRNFKRRSRRGLPPT